ncbi:MAG: hypothetical protein LBN22_00685 [Clostridiales Family XIII bacterium]|jgi:hypothetical protein|nr:hypothetical protein [Clostridiales Family XIII bacterium]
MDHYTRILYTLGFFGAIAWGFTSIYDAYLACELFSNLFPYFIQAACCIAVAVWTGYMGGKQWLEYYKVHKNVR